MSTLEARELVKEFPLPRSRRLRAVDELSIDLVAGETVALVGESGSGKSTVAAMLARLTRPTSGSIHLDGAPAGRRGRALRRYHSQVQIVFQDPFSSLNPFHTVDHHLRRPIELHHPALRKSEVGNRVEELLERVNLFPAKRIAAKRPHELSGGQRQRVAIARALAPGPKVLLADEPVSMLDVSIRLDILALIDRLREEDRLAVLYITHDLATARHFARRITVMYRGEMVESGPSDDVILAPQHPYTRLLAAAAPDPGNRTRSATTATSATSAPASPGGCRFRGRCPRAMPVCAERPPLLAVGPAHEVRCWLYQEGSR